MNIDNLAGMFSQRSGVQQSMGNSIMSAIIGFIVQKMIGQGLGNMLSGGGSGSGSGLGGTQSILSGLGGGLNRDHELVRHVQQNAGIKDPETARQYTQQGVDVLNEQSRSNPHIYGLDIRTGIQTWKFPTMNIIDSSPCIASNMLFIGGRDGLLYAFGSQDIASYIK